MCIVCAVGGGFIFGYSLGVSGVTHSQKSFIQDFCVDTYGTAEQCFAKDSLKPAPFIYFSTQFTAMLNLGCVFGAIGGAVLNDYIGRKNSLVFSTFLFSFASIFSAFASTAEMVLTSRFLVGLGVGASSTVAPVLIAEVSTTSMRGRLSCILPLMIGVGLFTAAAASEVFETNIHAWRICLGLPAIPAIICAAAMCLYPESPRWLMLQHGWDAAENALLTLRPSREIQRELDGISHLLRESENEVVDSSWGALCNGPMLKRCAVACMLQTLLVGTGINMIYSYGTNILADVGIYNHNVGLLLIYLMSCIGTTVALFQIDHVGRRALLLQGAIGTFCGHLGSAATVVIMELEDDSTIDSLKGELGECLFASFVGVSTLYIAASLGALAWVYPSEIFPHGARSKAVCLTTLVHWLTVYLSSYSLEIIYTLGVASTFFLLAMMSILTFLYVAYYIPETKDHSLEEIQMLFTTSTTLHKNRNIPERGYENHKASLKAMYNAAGATPTHVNEEERPLMGI